MKKNEREIKKHPELKHPDALSEFATGYHVLSNEGPLALRPCFSTSLLLSEIWIFIHLFNKHYTHIYRKLQQFMEI